MVETDGIIRQLQRDLAELRHEVVVSSPVKLLSPSICAADDEETQRDTPQLLHIDEGPKTAASENDDLSPEF